MFLKQIQSGFALMEAMMALAGLSISLLAISTIYQTAQKTQRAAFFQQVVSESTTDAAAAINSDSGCLATMSQLAPGQYLDAAVSLSSILDSRVVGGVTMTQPVLCTVAGGGCDPLIVTRWGGAGESARLRVQGIQYRYIRAIAGGVHEGKINVSLTPETDRAIDGSGANIASNLVPGQMITQEYPVAFRVDGAGSVNGCQTTTALAQDPMTSCLATPGAFWDANSNTCIRIPTSALNRLCGANENMTYNAATDSVTCTNVCPPPTTTTTTTTMVAATTTTTTTTMVACTCTRTCVYVPLIWTGSSCQGDATATGTTTVIPNDDCGNMCPGGPWNTGAMTAAACTGDTLFSSSCL